MTRRHLMFLACWLTAAILCARPMQANPGAGIVVDDHGQIFFTDTGAGIWKIDTGGKLTLVSKHIYKWIAIDKNGKFAAMRNNNWHRIDTAGDGPALLGSNDRPIAVSGDGNLYHAACHYSGPLLIVREVPSRDSLCWLMFRPMDTPLVCAPWMALPWGVTVQCISPSYKP